MRRFLVSALGITLIVLTSCSSENEKSSSTTASNWIRHSDPSGFVVQHPENWQIEKMNDRWLWIHNADKSESALVYPLLTPQPIAGEQCIQEGIKALSAALPGARVENFKRIKPQPDEVVASISLQNPVASQAGSTSNTDTSSQGMALCSIYGRSGMFYAISAPKSKFKERRDSLVKILKSFSFSGPAQGAAPQAPDAGIQYIRWQDPLEAAFSVEVPNGWQVQGGLTRGGPLDVRPWVALVAPDSTMRIIAGDGNIPLFSSPTFSMLATGIWPGSWYDPGYGNKFLVKYYLAGADFAKEYISQMISQWCSGVQVTDARDRPDVSQPINQSYMQSAYGGIISQISTGEAAFTCTMNGQPMQGYLFAGTNLTRDTSSYEIAGTWNMQYLLGYVAQKDRIETAEAVLGRIVKSYQSNAAWAQAQQGVAAASSQIVSQTSNQISQIITDSYWTRQGTQSNAARNWSNATLGLTDVRDERTGETWKVASGHNYYWRQDQTAGGVVGTDQYERPDIDFSPLVQF